MSSTLPEKTGAVALAENPVSRVRRPPFLIVCSRRLSADEQFALLDIVVHFVSVGVDYRHASGRAPLTPRENMELDLRDLILGDGQHEGHSYA